MKVSAKKLFSDCEPTENCGLFTFTKEIHKRKLHFLYSDHNKNQTLFIMKNMQELPKYWMARKNEGLKAAMPTLIYCSSELV